MLPNGPDHRRAREPMACCFSNLKQLFANGQEFTYGIEDIARYYRHLPCADAALDSVLPGTYSAHTSRGCRC